MPRSSVATLLATFASIALLASCARGLTGGSSAGATPSAASVAAGSPTSAASAPSPTATALATPSDRTPSPTATALATPSDRTPSPACVNPPLDVLTLAYQSDPVACYGSTSLTVDAYLSSPGVFDGPCTATEPTWLSCNAWVALDLPKTAATTSITLAYVPVSYSLYAAVHPTLGTVNQVLGQFGGKNVRVTGHFDDLAAPTCRYTTGSGWPNAEFTAPDLISSCRHLFVVTKIVTLAP